MDVEPVVIASEVAYDGTRYAGWARQERDTTIQGLLAGALEQVFLRRLPETHLVLHGASRTDAGVHALGQVASFVLGSDRTGGRQATAPHASGESVDLARAMTSLASMLPADVRVLRMGVAPPGFDARRSSIGKRYRYHMSLGRSCSPFLSRYVLEVPVRTDPEPMREAAAALLGDVDMRAFMARAGHEGPAPRAIKGSSLRLDERMGVWVYEIEASGFLRHAVRRIVGTLLMAGQGKLSPRDVQEIAREGRSVDAGPTVPPHGLFLWEVLYPEGTLPWTAADRAADLLTFPGL
ncbi:MAG: tRNA pseudouridine synthase A [Acidobacteriota bacterium]